MKHYCLPFPPSVNGYWGTRASGGKYLTRKGKAYRQAALQAIGDVETFSDSVAVYAVMHPPDARTRDVDNYWKGLLDAMTAAGVWIDDSQVRLQVGLMGGKVKGGQVDVYVEELTGDFAGALLAMIEGLQDEQ
jgi:crossover junction endodeoxyribonuclease RusA